VIGLPELDTILIELVLVRGELFFVSDVGVVIRGELFEPVVVTLSVRGVLFTPNGLIIGAPERGELFVLTVIFDVFRRFDPDPFLAYGGGAGRFIPAEND